MKRVDLVGVNIIKNVLSVTGGPGGRPAPSALEEKLQGVGIQFQQEIFKYSLSTTEVLFGQLVKHGNLPEKTKFHQNRQKSKRTR